jgi:hypothetical protein
MAGSVDGGIDDWAAGNATFDGAERSSLSSGWLCPSSHPRDGSAVRHGHRGHILATLGRKLQITEVNYRDVFLHLEAFSGL